MKYRLISLLYFDQFKKKMKRHWNQAFPNEDPSYCDDYYDEDNDILIKQNEHIRFNFTLPEQITEMQKANWYGLSFPDTSLLYDVKWSTKNKNKENECMVKVLRKEDVLMPSDTSTFYETIKKPSLIRQNAFYFGKNFFDPIKVNLNNT